MVLRQRNTLHIPILIVIPILIYYIESQAKLSYLRQSISLNVLFIIFNYLTHHNKTYSNFLTLKSMLVSI